MQPETTCTNNSPPGFTGHWRDWHRGHGCDKDDGKPHSEAGIDAITEAVHEPRGREPEQTLTMAESKARREGEISGREKLTFTKRSEATTYHFRAEKHFGWALCTVNNSTGELNITSDWGAWSYRWHTAHLGEVSLTHFIANREVDDGRHYIADKLTSDDRSKRWVFSPELTVAHLLELLRERVACGEVDAHAADELKGALDDLKHTEDVRDFVNAYYEIDHYKSITDAVEFEHLQNELVASYIILRDAIVPALIAACRDHLAKFEGTTV